MNSEFQSDFYDNHLKSFPAPKAHLDHEDVHFFGSLSELLQITCKTTGIHLRFVRAGGTIPESIPSIPMVPVDSRSGKTVGHLVVCDINEAKPPMSDKDVELYTGALAEFLGDAYRWQLALRQSEAEHATSVPVSCRVRSNKKISEFLRNQLKDSCRIVGCQSSALYILSEDSKQLKLRCVWGLPEEKLFDPPRLLRDSYADMEAMLGQAVILNEDFLMETWRPPDDFPTAVCVPVLSEMNVYGTIWFYANERRDFSNEELAIMEITSGRVSAEIEKAALVKEIKILRG